MTKVHNHYESLNVTRDAPAEVIRAAYRSLSQKHHPDKNMEHRDAAAMMARLNTAYSVLSDPDQRASYDLQLKRKNAVVPLLHYARNYLMGRNGKIVIVALGGLSIVIITALWLAWKDNQSMLRLGQAAIYTTDTQPSAAGQLIATKAQNGLQATNNAPKTRPAGAGANPTAALSGLRAATAELSQPAAATKAPLAPSPAAQASDYARLAAMLKSMGWGLHKLDSSAPASSTAQPPLPAAAAEPARTVTAASTNPAPALVQAAKPLAPTESGRARNEIERPVAPDAVRSDAQPLADASRASAQPVASPSAISATLAPQPAVFADAGGCAAPSYPIKAFRNGESGSVLLALLVGSDGKVIKSKVQKSSGSAELDMAARKAVSTCQFKPASNDAHAEPAWATLSYVWTLD